MDAIRQATRTVIEMIQLFGTTFSMATESGCLERGCFVQADRGWN